MKIKEALRQSTVKLQQGGVESAPLDAEILLSFASKKGREYLYTYLDKKLDIFQKIKFKYLINRRLNNFPIAYLTHQKEFYGYNFYVNRHVLIPRPLTEQMIDLALNEIKACPERSRGEQKTKSKKQIIIADIGTGSGNIIISLIKQLQKERFNLNNFKFYASDISASTLKVAKKNAQRHGVLKYINFLKGDLLKPLQGKTIDLILANLPYLNITDVQKEPSIQKEPPGALIGDFYPQLFKQIRQRQPRPAIIFEDKTGVRSC